MLVRMLGPFEAGRPVAGGSQRTVLALLALHAGQPVSVAALVDALWPDGAPASARNSLQSHVARLRAALGTPGLITLTPAGYCLAVARDQVDVLLFEDLLKAGAAETALELWRGEPLPEFEGEPFRGLATRLTGVHREAWAAISEKGGPDDELRAAVAADPCWERGAVTLARSEAEKGRRGEALETLRRYSDAVVDQLGIDPSEAVRELQVAILRHEPEREPQKTAVPLRFSTFLGRAGEQRELAGLMAEPGLVTVTGPGGVGKTRLVAETVRARSRVAWVDAADVSAADFPAAVALAVGARPGPLDEPVVLAGRHAREFTVVVLDNCEHVVEGAARVAEAMRGVRVVVTSQERLRVDGERVLELGPLGGEAAARLFRERARITDGGDAVGEIVDRLDRLPLAIELAATQAAALGVGELRERLDDRLDLLVRGQRTGAARHRTLRAVVQWSYGLLDDRERAVLSGLSVFAGAFTVGQAEAVVGGAAVAATLASLVDRSLVARHGPGRFRLLETVRAYASEQLGAAREALFDRHAEAMLTAVRRLDREFRGPGQVRAVRELDGLLPDLRLVVARGRVAEPLAAALYRYGYRCQQYEVLAWGRTALAAADTHAADPDALAAAATHAWGRGDLAEARAFAERAAHPTAAIHEVLGDVALVSCDPATALAHYRAMDGEPVHRVAGLVGEALVLAWSGRAADAVAVARSAVDLADATGNPGARAEARYGLGEALGDSDPERALELLTEAAGLAATVDDRLFRGASETAAVAIRSRHGDPAAALASFREVLALWREVGNDTLRAAALRNLVVLLVRVGADETAVLVDAALPPADVYPAEQARIDRARAAVAERLGAGRVAALRRRGALLSPAAVHDEASRAIDAALSRMAG
ncbi:winged helix-turn-helix domain-containing protein [Actinoplanes sp. LDG1-06]|uniref:Winged helix-turn-helix domain-containing protein n=1 Tax=Paractinoplanes ovalisporus TaxID=2810368 RepID=A0ABS2AQL1_9ACTN|nr:BTAD domain-containing putative transcriptional regulator [Actinoplanes ovalisporus]MBM2622140.1 winged helix-turn-helix domain-containing protein [Actinoplanes ovalisporus]